MLPFGNPRGQGTTITGQRAWPARPGGMARRVAAGRPPVVPPHAGVIEFRAGAGAAPRLLGVPPPLPGVWLTAKGRRLCLVHGLSSLLGPWSAYEGAPATSDVA